MFRPFRLVAIVAVCSLGPADYAGAQAVVQNPALRAHFGTPSTLPARLDAVAIPVAVDTAGNREPGAVSTEGTRLSEAGQPEKSEDRIETDRDSFTPATRLVTPGRVIMESAYSFLDNRAKPETHSFPESLIRIGLLERLELRLGWNYEAGGGGDVSGSQAENPVEGLGVTREHRITYGVKAGLTTQDRWVPDSVAILEAFTPTGGEVTATQFAGTYSVGWDLPRHWRLDAAMRCVFGSEKGDHFNVWAPSVVLRMPLRERWNVHVEYFGLYSQNRAEDFTRHYFSPGIHYLVTSDLEVGVRVGWGLNEQAARFFCNAGFGWRF